MSVLPAFLITLIAGLATGIGGGIVFFAKRQSPIFLSVCLGFSAGIMIYLSFMEILPSAFLELPNQSLGVFAFFIGALIIGIIDLMVQNNENPHEFFHKSADLKRLPLNYIRKHLLKTGILMMIAVTIHNFPEGFATFLSLLHHPEVGMGLAIAVMLHNIPEGIAVSIPVFYATNSRKKALWFSIISGVSEPLGALVGYWILKPFLSASVTAFALAGTAGVMVYIALEELLPTAHKYGQNHLVISSVFVGMVVMGIVFLIH